MRASESDFCLVLFLQEKHKDAKFYIDDDGQQKPVPSPEEVLLLSLGLAYASSSFPNILIHSFLIHSLSLFQIQAEVDVAMMELDGHIAPEPLPQVSVDV